MTIISIDKSNRTQNLVEQLLKIWESSVRATHLFLSEKEIINIKNYVPQALHDVAILIIATNAQGVPIAFMGIENHKLEMLFVDASERGKGIGTELLQYGIEKYSVNELRVNEQNPMAKAFYEKNGFQVYDRAVQDEQGQPYPILFMRLNSIK